METPDKSNPAVQPLPASRSCSVVCLPEFAMPNFVEPPSNIRSLDSCQVDEAICRSSGEFLKPGAARVWRSVFGSSNKGNGTVLKIRHDVYSPK